MGIAWLTDFTGTGKCSLGLGPDLKQTPGKPVRNREKDLIQKGPEGSQNWSHRSRANYTQT